MKKPLYFFGRLTDWIVSPMIPTEVVTSNLAIAATGRLSRTVSPWV